MDVCVYMCMCECTCVCVCVGVCVCMCVKSNEISEIITRNLSSQ